MSDTHDYTYKEWGHSYEITSIEDEGVTITATGWGTGIKDGDYIIFKNGNDTTRYVFDSVTYFSDPHDMWSGSLTFSPRN